MIDYHEYEKAVYDYLLKKHGEDQNLCFSLRKKGSVGSERDYFIGTENSGYFATTFWNIPVAYPGSSMDLIDAVFEYTPDGKALTYLFQFTQRRKPHNEQNKATLVLIQDLKAAIKSAVGLNYESPDVNALEVYKTKPRKTSYTDIDEMVGDMLLDLSVIGPIIDAEIARTKGSFKKFNAHRLTKQEFDNQMKKLEERMVKYRNAPVSNNTVSGKAATNSGRPAYDPPKNQILYGPPGTGKTYSSVSRAIQIIDGLDETGLKEKYKTRDEIRKRFDNLLITDWENPTGQIAFITFHQSLSYEDFIEGIKPGIDEKLGVTYDVQPGIFKALSNMAKSNWHVSKEKMKGKLSFEEAFDFFREEWEGNQGMLFPLKTKGKEYTVTGFSKTSIRFRKASGGTGHTLSIATLRNYYYGWEELGNAGINIYYPAILQKLKSYQPEKKPDNEEKKFVLIIDEINRGNVSKVFGELITLLEEDKRLGNGESLELTLPYSNEIFGVPPNLYLIGTMNTADRSVEALDAALRRRFSFEEIRPDSNLLSPYQSIKRLWEKYKELEWEDEPWLEAEKAFADLYGMKVLDHDAYEELEEQVVHEGLNMAFDGVIEFGGYDMSIIHQKINARIEKLLDRDHQIGHSYFMEVFSYEDLKRAFHFKVLPLMQEYFFGDYGKIGLVLGKGFVEKVNANGEDIKFAEFDEYDAGDFEERPIYIIKDTLNMDVQEFKAALDVLIA